MKRVYVDYLRDMLENAERALRFIQGIDYEAFAGDDKSIYAVVRALEIIGEAGRKVPDDVQAKYPEVPWRDVAGMRNKLMHEYFGVNVRVVWRTVQEDLPGLIPHLRKILEWEK